MSMPTVPPRPARTQNQAAGPTASMDVPRVPPRPARRPDRSASPNRNTFARSPLNDPSFVHKASHGPNGLGSKRELGDSPPRRPPSVTLPSIGQEGQEYASLLHLTTGGSGDHDHDHDREKDAVAAAAPGDKMAYADDDADADSVVGKPEQTKNVAGDLPLYAPTASMPKSMAKSRIATVTRTDSSQAEAAGVGKGAAYDGADDSSSAAGGAGNKAPRPPSSTSGGGGAASASGFGLGLDATRSSSSLGTRPQSIYKEDEEHGIPEIGIQVPMYPNAGDVQAPTPAPGQAGPFQTSSGSVSGGGVSGAGAGGLGSGDASAPVPQRPRHQRTKSGREIFTVPPGSYGLHGHGVEPRHPLEKKWYEKHPEALEGEYGPGIQENRKDYHLSSDDLNKLVRETARNGVGMGSGVNAMSTPDEMIGYMAHEEFASRMASPRPPSVAKGRSGSSQTHAESPLRKASFPINELKKKTSTTSEAGAVESEAEEDVIHIDAPQKSVDWAPSVPGDEHEDRETPILAEDEVAKHPEAEYLQPAVSPEPEGRRSSMYTTEELDALRPKSSSSRPTTRPTSRNNSLHSPPAGMSRFQSSEDHHEPLEHVKEYEPLFPEEDEDDEDDEAGQKHRGADGGKGGSGRKGEDGKVPRPALPARHYFPSKDVWEDTPNSLQLQTVVDHLPSPTDEKKAAAAFEGAGAGAFETPEQEQSRKRAMPGAKAASDKQLRPAGEDEDEDGDGGHADFLSAHQASRQGAWHNRHLRRVLDEEGGAGGRRPGMQQRFPSQDIWEDTPDHHQLVTVVRSPPSVEEQKEQQQLKEQQQKEVAEDQRQAEAAMATATAATAKPSVPPRPPRKQPSGDAGPDKKAPPSVPERPKPSVPARPGAAARAPTKRSSAAAAADEEAAAPAPKPKPAAPARPPPGGKIAALQAGFMKDLNSRLQLGQQGVRMPGASEKGEARGGGKESEREDEQDEEEEKRPLGDARKGRARGPARRRRPGAAASSGSRSPGPAAGAATATVAPKGAPAAADGQSRSALRLSFAPVWTALEIGEDGGVGHGAEKKKAPAPAPAEAEAEDLATPKAEVPLASAMGGSAVAEPAAEAEAPVEVDEEEVSEEDGEALRKGAGAAKDEAVQTGRKDVAIGAGVGAGEGMGTGMEVGVGEKLTAFVGGKAPDEGDVVVRGKEGGA
ncbi:altered inheritance of mitochondria protein 21 [Lineolata rhizophorae]|uniref:Altered inheritance of mitochondria protein 21 n=1 Tax=Lineolata rhizophorae TaxID=578093 RepID=A0A6A6P1L9_9PEZI|nr:altered inheritance of mitochondria protein 21 [Lineolata rhizophorae]